MIGSGVGKSGSPAPKPITGLPAALSALALASTASVADSVMALTRSEMRRWAAVMKPSCHYRGADRPSWPLTGSTAASQATTLQPLVAVQLVDPRAPAWADGASTRTAVDGGTARRHGRIHHRAVAQLARVPVSKTGGWGFESLLPCEHGPRLAGLLHR